MVNALRAEAVGDGAMIRLTPVDSSDGGPEFSIELTVARALELRDQLQKVHAEFVKNNGGNGLTTQLVPDGSVNLALSDTAVAALRDQLTSHLEARGTDT